MRRSELVLLIVVVLVLVGIPVALNRPRGIRNGNPMNLRPLPGGKTWDGEISPDIAKGGPFSRWKKGEEWKGWRAGGIDVFGDILKRGQNTIKRLISGTPERAFKDAYAPASDNNNEKKYIAALTKALHVAEDFPLNVQIHGPALAHAIAKHENGIDPDLVWGKAAREKGIAAALEYVLA